MISMTLPQALRNECSVDGHKIALTPQMATILMVLLINRGKVIEFYDLFDAIWHDHEKEWPDWARSHLRVQVYRLQQRIGRGVIIPVPARGYRIDR